MGVGIGGGAGDPYGHIVIAYHTKHVICEADGKLQSCAFPLWFETEEVGQFYGTLTQHLEVREI